MIELLAPAGDLEKLKIAIDYGADACYVGGEIFGLRAAAANFSLEDLKEGVQYAHERAKKVYLVLNIIPHEEDLAKLTSFLDDIRGIPVDAFILSDPGTLMVLREKLGAVEVHLSTQANTTNARAAAFWHSQGVKRIILARELSLQEIRTIVSNTAQVDFEVFVHGAMCMSYSGRCLISNFMTGRDANRGDCAQSCRWNYVLMEEKRAGEYYPIEETPSGTTFFNSKDLNALPILPEILESGVQSIKIEGRNKTIYYVASIVRVYREALRRIQSGFYEWEDLYAEVRKVSHRDFSLGFFKGKPSDQDQLYAEASYIRTYDFCGLVLDYDQASGMATIEQRNHFRVGDTIEVFGPDFFCVTTTITRILNQDGDEVAHASHAQQIVYIPMPMVHRGDMLRKKRI